MPPEERPSPSRRALLAGTAPAVLLGLAGCGIRLEDDAPRVPLVPARSEVPGEDLLTALVRDCARLADLAAGLPGPTAAAVAALHARQRTVLRTALVAEGVPADLLDTAGPAATPTPTPSPSGPPDARARRSELAVAEAEAAGGVAAFVVVEPALRPPVAALHAQRQATARILGVPDAGPAAVEVGDEAVGAVADEVAGAVYLLEVAGARGSQEDRDRATTSRAALLALRTEVLAGSGARSRAVGHPLPFVVDDHASARRLAREALGTLRSAVGSHVGPLVADAGADGLVASTRWLAAVEVEAHRWGLDLAPFPGLT